MGLTIHYTLTLKRGTTERWFKHLLRRTRRLALKIGCPKVGPVLDSVEIDLGAPEFFKTASGDERRLNGGPGTRGWLLEVWPGEGCETALFGTLRHRLVLPPRKGRPRGETRYAKRTKWELSEHCKTCYAARHGAEHFIECHLRVIRLLDYWREAGVKVEVHDETGYWKTRDLKPLVLEGTSYFAYLKKMGGELES